jgi:membrane-associated phospholipid phosphatase
MGNLFMRRIVAFRWWYLFFFAAGLVLLASFYLDAGAQVWIVQHQNTGARRIMGSVSHFGDWPEHISLGLTLLALAYWRRSKKWMRILAAMILACALAGAGTRVVKILAGRARPSAQTEAAWNGPNLSARYNAFPSGHTAASTAFFATLALACWRIGTPFLVIPLLIAFSRMYVAAHYLSDVVCASLIGLFSAYCIARWISPTIRNPQSEIRN